MIQPRQMQLLRSYRRFSDIYIWLFLAFSSLFLVTILDTIFFMLEFMVPNRKN